MARARLHLLPFTLLTLALVFAVACGGGDQPKPLPTRTPAAGGQQPRSYLMGFSSQPPLPGDEAYKATFRFIGDMGEVVLIQRAPPWTDFLPGATISERTQALTSLEREQARVNNLKLFLAVDATDPADRGQLNSLPDELKGHDFSDSRVRSAFIAYAQYLALNYKPAYMALGVEMDLYYGRRGDGPFRNFQSVYFEAYDAVKRASPSTLVFPTFQYEAMIGALRSGERAQVTWSLVNRFEPKIDMLAVSSYPFTIYKTPEEIPPNYYQALRGRLDRPIALVSIGWPSSAEGLDLMQAETAQANYLRRTLTDADMLRAGMVIWYLARDPTVNLGATFQPLETVGLFAADGRSKPGLNLWRLLVDRPAPR
jgi:hypothetical protein